MPHSHSHLSSLAHSKLHLSVARETRSLHRWVLLKNSITTPAPTSSFSACPATPPPTPSDEDSDTFMFPDAGELLNSSPSGSSPSEAQWLDTLLANLTDDDEEDFSMDHPVPSSEEDDDSFLLSPLISPMSSSDDLASPDNYFQPHPYPVPYPPYHPPPLQKSVVYEDPLPYSHVDDPEDSSVPDAIEDTSDDESDTPTTPSLGRSNDTFHPLHRSPEAPFPHIDPASVPLPQGHRSPRPRGPHVYVDPSDVNFYPFQLDPLPFSYNSQEC